MDTDCVRARWSSAWRCTGTASPLSTLPDHSTPDTTSVISTGTGHTILASNIVWYVQIIILFQYAWSCKSINYIHIYLASRPGLYLFFFSSGLRRRLNYCMIIWFCNSMNVLLWLDHGVQVRVTEHVHRAGGGELLLCTECWYYGHSPTVERVGEAGQA